MIDTGKFSPPLFQTVINDWFEKTQIGTVNWRPLPYTEARVFSLMELTPELEDQIWDMCLVETNLTVTELEDLGGIKPTIVKQMLAFSGALPSEELLPAFEAGMMASRVEVESALIEQLTIVICSAFPYRPEDVEKLPWPVILKRAAQAERIIMGQLPQLPLTTQAPKQRKFDINKEVVFDAPKPNKRTEIKNLQREFRKQRGGKEGM